MQLSRFFHCPLQMGESNSVATGHMLEGESDDPPDCPIFVYHRKEPVHLIGNIFEVRRKVVPNVYGPFAVTTSKLGNVRDRRVIQGPERVLIERLDTFSRPISIQFDSKSYCRKRFCSWIFAKARYLFFSLTDT